MRYSETSSGTLRENSAAIELPETELCRQRDQVLRAVVVNVQGREVELHALGRNLRVGLARVGEPAGFAHGQMNAVLGALVEQTLADRRERDDVG